MSFVTGLQTGLEGGGLISGLNASVFGVVAPQDGPGSVYRPTADAHWTALGLPVPAYYFLCQDASGNLAEVNGGTVLTATGAGLNYSQAVTGWTALHVGTDEAGSAQRWVHGLAVGVDTSTTSFAMLLYCTLAQGAASRRFAQFGASGNDLRVGTAGLVSLVRTGNVTTGVVSHDGATTVRPYLLVIDRTGSTIRLYTTLEQINGSFGAIVDGPKGYGQDLLSTPASNCNLIAMWSGASAEGLNASTLTTLGWSLAY